MEATNVEADLPPLGTLVDVEEASPKALQRAAPAAMTRAWTARGLHGVWEARAMRCLPCMRRAQTGQPKPAKKVVCKGQGRTLLLRDIVERHGEDTNLYRICGLPDFAKMDKATSEQLNAAPAAKDEDAARRSLELLAAACLVLQQPDMKRRYDLELVRQAAGNVGLPRKGRCIALIVSVLLFYSGLAVIICGAVMAHGTKAYSLGGGAVLTAGLRGSLLLMMDRDFSFVEWAAYLLIGLLQGLVANVCILGIGWPKSEHHLVMQWLHLNFLGWAMQASTMAVNDLGEMLCAGGYLGRLVQDNVVNMRAPVEVLCLPNARHFTLSTLVGPLFAWTVGAAPVKLDHLTALASMQSKDGVDLEAGSAADDEDDDDDEVSEAATDEDDRAVVSKAYGELCKEESMECAANEQRA